MGMCNPLAPQYAVAFTEQAAAENDVW